MTLKELGYYRVICKEIEQREAQLQRDKFHVVDAVETAADFPYWKHTIPIEGDLYPYPLEPVSIRLDVLRRKKAQIEKFVSEAQDYKVRRAMELRYLEPASDRVTWEMVADQLGDGASGWSAKKMVQRYIKRT